MGILQVATDSLLSDWSSTAATLATVFGVLWLTREVYIWHIHLRHIPGPFTNSISCYYLLFTWGFSGRLNKWVTSQNEKYGRVIRLGPNHVITDSPSTLRRLGALRSPYTKSSWYTTITRLVPSIDSTLSLGGTPSANALHHERHALFAPTYAGRDNTSPPLEDVVNAQVASLIRYLSSKADTGAVVDFSSVAQYFALDTIGDVLWGEPFGFLREDADIGGYVQTLQDFLPVRAALSSLPVLEWFRWGLGKMLPKETDEVGLGRLMGVARAKINKKVEEGAKGKGGDMLGGLMQKGLEGDELFSELVMAIVAGSDNTASSLRIAIALLVVAPAAYRRLDEEITAGIAAGKISSPVTDSEARAMPYLQAVIRETLRLYPIPAEFYKEVPPEGDTVEGVFLPGGTWLGCNMYSMMRRKDLWGDDSEQFRPERWLDAAAEEKTDGGERFRNMCNLVDLGFGSGRFQCLGKPMGLMEMNKVIVEMMRHFDFAAVNPERPVDVGGYLMYLIKGQLLRFERKGG